MLCHLWNKILNFFIVNTYPVDCLTIDIIHSWLDFSVLDFPAILKLFLFKIFAYLRENALTNIGLQILKEVALHLHYLPLTHIFRVKTHGRASLPIYLPAVSSVYLQIWLTDARPCVSTNISDWLSSTVYPKIFTNG
jgi:hypothetical protein